ncbi:DNA repair protein complementing XP-C cells homolog isoform X2 [Uloborus diversus]|nr:DNA repair protein complementing XP-C cells homolog isoform X2 [Uloborus diversus]XP_054710391.1 DNA repair protein complementing XP-C cells homolog isoform X2 [Uloborus diversus]
MGRPKKRQVEEQDCTIKEKKKKINEKQKAGSSGTSGCKSRKNQYVKKEVDSDIANRDVQKPNKRGKCSNVNQCSKDSDACRVRKKRIKCENEDSGYEPSSLSTDSGDVLSNNTEAVVLKPEAKSSNNSSSSESEWEEVEEQSEQNLEDYKPSIPEGGVEITIDCPNLNIRKRKKKQFDEMEYIRLYINRARKDAQLCKHKVHLLCLLSHGFYVNSVLNSAFLKSMALSLIPIDVLNISSGKKVDKIDVDGIEKIVTWFRSSFTFESNKDAFINLNNSLISSFEKRCSSNSSEYNLMFVGIARVLGFKARFCLPLYPMTYKAQNLMKKSGKLKEEDKVSETLSSELCDSKASCSSKPKLIESSKKLESKSDISKSKKKVKAPCKKKNEQSDKMKKKAESASRPRRSAGKSYKISSDESDDESKDRNFNVHVGDNQESDDNCDKPRKTSSKIKKKEAKTDSNKSNRRVLSSDSESSSLPELSYKPDSVLCWAEIYSKPEKQWISVECSTNLVNKPSDVEALVPHPVAYIVSYDNESHIKDVTRRYCEDFLTSIRKLRADPDWWEETIEPFLPPNSKLDQEEEKKLDQMLINKPLPTTVAAFKNHPLYALKRHLLKFEAIYPPDAPPVGFFRQEPIYARDCVCQLHSRETWLKEARVVRIGEEPYKIVKARPKWDKMAGVMRTDLPLEIFGLWQTEPYEPPIAVDGKVPRNEYGNVELFKPCMLPRGTVHLQIPCLNRIARKLGIDCSPAVVGFDGHKGSVHPVFDGFVVCEEFKDTLLAAWDEEQENTRKREEEKREKRIYGNWKKLIKGLLIRERIKTKYDVK